MKQFWSGSFSTNEIFGAVPVETLAFTKILCIFWKMISDDTMIFRNLKINFGKHFGTHGRFHFWTLTTFEHCRQTLVFRKMKFFVAVHLIEPNLTSFHRRFSSFHAQKYAWVSSFLSFRSQTFINILVHAARGKVGERRWPSVNQNWNIWSFVASKYSNWTDLGSAVSDKLKGWTRWVFILVF